jgi:hypothetical protein
VSVIFPFLVELTYEPAQNATQEPPQADAQDRQQGDEKIERIEGERP